MPIYTYRCKKCTLEFDAKHAMDYTMKKHDEIENEPCNGEVERAVYVPVTTSNYLPPAGIDLEYRVREHIENAAYELTKDMNTKIDIKEEDLKAKAGKYGD